MTKSFLVGLLFVLSCNFAYGAQVSCKGKISSVGYLPQYSGKVLALSTDYRNGIWAKAGADENSDMVMSLLLAGLMADKVVSVQFKTVAGETCESIDQYTGAVTIERVFVLK